VNETWKVSKEPGLRALEDYEVEMVRCGFDALRAAQSAPR